MTITAGVDLGTGTIKTVLFKIEGDQMEWLARRSDRIRQRDPFDLAEKGYDAVKGDFNLILEKYSDKDGGKLAKMIFAKICYDGGDYDRSIELYKLALQDFDTQPFYKSRILCNLGYLYADKGDYDNAVKYFEMVEVISGSTDKDEALFNLAGIFATKGLLEKSNNTYKKLIDNYPNSTYLDISKENILP